MSGMITNILGLKRDQARRNTPSLGGAIGFWWKLGWISFGGTAAHLAIMQSELVEKRRWIDSDEFFHGLGHCMLLPGPEAQQLAIYIGWKLHGKVGGFLAGTLFVLPSTAILLGLSLLYAQYGSVWWVIFVFRMLKPIVVALVFARALSNRPSRSEVRRAMDCCNRIVPRSQPVTYSVALDYENDSCHRYDSRTDSEPERS